jgi:hypothetical protein
MSDWEQIGFQSGMLSHSLFPVMLGASGLGVFLTLSRLRWWWSLVVRASKCSFWENVLCQSKKNDRFVVLRRCLTCPHYRRFEREMEEEEDEFFDYVERVRSRGNP